LIPPPFTWTRHIITTVILWGISTILAIVVTDLGAVQSFVGGFSAVTLGFILPSACAIQVNILHTPDRIGCTLWRHKLLTKQNGGPIALFVFGCIVMVACMIQSVSSYA
jgi:amino acid permease